MHVSFQSTSSCNISKCELSVSKREREREREPTNKLGVLKWIVPESYIWARTLALIQLIIWSKIVGIKYQSWKYWHRPMLHATALAIVIAYDMYLEVAEGKLNSDWKVTFPVNFWTFRDVLSLQMLHYNPEDRTYPGDDSMSVCTKQSKSQRVSKKKSRQDLEDDDTDGQVWQRR